MKKRKLILWILLGLLLAAGIIGAVRLCTGIVPTVNHGLRISELLQPVTEAKNQTMHISVSASVNGHPISLKSDVYMVTEGDIRYLALEQEGLTVYIADNILILDSGKAFQLGEKMQAQAGAYEELLPRVGALYGVLKINAEETDTQTVYSVTVTGEQMDTLLAAASLGEALPVEGIRELELSLTEKEDKLKEIRFSGSGGLNGTEVRLDVTVSGFRILAAGDYPIPEAVRQTAETVDPDGLFSLTEDLFRLISALAPLAELETIDGSLELRVDCGLIQLDTEMRLSELKQSASGQLDPEQLKALPEAVGLLCLAGDISCTQTGDGYTYLLELDGEDMGQLARMILPELARYGGSLTEGSVTIVLEGGTVSSLDVSMKGTVSVLIAQLPVTVGATFSFD